LLFVSSLAFIFSDLQIIFLVLFTRKIICKRHLCRVRKTAICSAVFQRGVRQITSAFF
jgi:hypothetical protein